MSLGWSVAGILFIENEMKMKSFHFHFIFF